MTTFRYQVFSQVGIGRRAAESAVRQFKKYISKKGQRAILSKAKKVTLVGALLSLSGLFLVILTALFGQFSNTPPKRSKKSS
jgi:hypothetical protein